MRRHACGRTLEAIRQAIPAIDRRARRSPPPTTCRSSRRSSRRPIIPSRPAGRSSSSATSSRSHAHAERPGGRVHGLSEDAFYTAVRYSLPDAGWGDPVPQATLLTAHRAAWQLAKLDDRSEVKAILIEPDAVRRIALDAVVVTHRRRRRAHRRRRLLVAAAAGAPGHRRRPRAAGWRSAPTCRPRRSSRSPATSRCSRPRSAEQIADAKRRRRLAPEHPQHASGGARPRHARAAEIADECGRAS